MANVTLPVSVVIPAHNSQSTIERAIASVFAQTYLPKEIIVVDDCSTDDTRDLIRRIETISPVSMTLIVLDHNVGPSHTRNTGWDTASQEYIAFLDSDDTWHPQKLEIQGSWMLSHPECEVSGHLTSAVQVSIGDCAPKTRSFNLRHFLIKNRISTPTVMVKREIRERFDSSLWYAEDYELWLRILARTGQITRLESQLTQLHKADFGESGLSARLFSMYRGELVAVARLRSSGSISATTQTAVVLWMTTKYLIRLVRTWARKI